MEAGSSVPPPPPPGDAASPHGLAEPRPLSLGELLDRSVKVYRSSFLTFAKIVLVLVIPLQVLSVLMALATTPAGVSGGFETAIRQPGVDFTAGYIVGQIVIAILSAAAYLIIVGACYRAAADAHLGGRPDWRDSLGFAARRAHSLLWVGILYGLLVAVASLLLLLPGIYLYVAWVASIPALLLEDKRGFNALRRSFRLVRGSWWSTFARLLVAFVLVAIAGFLIALPFGLAVLASGGSLAVTLVVNAITTTLSNLIGIPFIGAIVVLIYLDLRAQKEGLDRELLAQRVGVNSPTGG